MSLVKSQPTPIQDNFRVDAKSRLTQLGMSITELATRLGVSRIAASQAINHGLHAPTRKRIAEFLSLKLQ